MFTTHICKEEFCGTLNTMLNFIISFSAVMIKLWTTMNPWSFLFTVDSDPFSPVAMQSYTFGSCSYISRSYKVTYIPGHISRSYIPGHVIHSTVFCGLLNALQMQIGSCNHELEVSSGCFYKDLWVLQRPVKWVTGLVQLWFPIMLCCAIGSTDNLPVDHGVEKHCFSEVPFINSMN